MGGSLADVISNLLTDPVYEWIRGERGRAIGSTRGEERLANNLPTSFSSSSSSPPLAVRRAAYTSFQSPGGGLGPMIDPTQVCSLEKNRRAV